MRSIKSTCWMVLLLIGVLSIPGLCQEQAKPAVRTGRVTTRSVIIRARPGTHFESLGRFQQDDQVRIIEENEGWYRVEVPETVQGWVPGDGVDGDGIVHKDISIFAGIGLCSQRLVVRKSAIA